MESDSATPAPDGFRGMNEDEYDRLVEERQTRMRAALAADLEAQKHEKWACKIGDLLEVTVPFETTDWEETEQSRRKVVQGDLYRATDLKGRGWDLERVSGDGPEELRVMNGDVPDYFKVLPRHD